VYGWINQWKQDDEWLWQSLGKIAGGVGATNKTLQMVDIDGENLLVTPLLLRPALILIK
jgi:hypothetical protein